MEKEEITITININQLFIIGMTTLSELEAWVQLMKGLGEADTPQAFGDVILTPNELLEHARKDDDVWKKAQHHIPR